LIIVRTASEDEGYYVCGEPVRVVVKGGIGKAANS